MGKWVLLVLLILSAGWTPTPGAPAGGSGEERPLNEVIWPVGG